MNKVHISDLYFFEELLAALGSDAATDWFNKYRRIRRNTSKNFEEAKNNQSNQALTASPASSESSLNENGSPLSRRNSALYMLNDDAKEMNDSAGKKGKSEHLDQRHHARTEDRINNKEDRGTNRI